MTLEAAFDALWLRLHAARDAVRELSRIVADHPVETVPRVVDRLKEGVDDALGLVLEAIESAAEGQQAVAHPSDIDRARRPLAGCHRPFNRAVRLLSTQLASHRSLDQLAKLGLERGGEWAAWARPVEASLELCQQSFFDASEALFDCWQELAERLGTTSVSVQTTNIGQHIALRKNEEMVGEGIS